MVIILTQNACCLKVSQTSNTQDCRINHRSRAGLRAVWAICQTLGVLWWHAPVVIYLAASHSCLSVLSKDKILWNLWHTVKILIWDTAWENLSSEICEQVRLNQVFHVRADISATILALYSAKSKGTDQTVRLCWSYHGLHNSASLFTTLLISLPKKNSHDIHSWLHV